MKNNVRIISIMMDRDQILVSIVFCTNFYVFSISMNKYTLCCICMFSIVFQTT